MCLNKRWRHARNMTEGTLEGSISMFASIGPVESAFVELEEIIAGCRLGDAVLAGHITM